jgi:hypothetical protein
MRVHPQANITADQAEISDVFVSLSTSRHGCQVPDARTTAQPPTKLAASGCKASVGWRTYLRDWMLMTKTGIIAGRITPNFAAVYVNRPPFAHLTGIGWANAYDQVGRVDAAFNRVREQLALIGNQSGDQA